MKPRAYPVSRPPRSRVEARTIYAPCAAGRGAVSMSRVPTHGKPTVLHEARPGNFRVGLRISTKARTGELVGALVGFDPPALRGANSISQRYESLVSRKSQFDSEDEQDLQQFDMSRDMYRLHAPQLANPRPFAPVQKVSRRSCISRPRVPVADVDGELFEEAQCGPVPGAHDDRRKRGHRRGGDVQRRHKQWTPRAAAASLCG